MTRSIWATFPSGSPTAAAADRHHLGLQSRLVHGRTCGHVVFGLLPMLDWLAGIAAKSREAPDLAFNRWFRLVTWLWVPVQLALIAWLVGTVPMEHLGPLELAGAAASVGATTGRSA